MTMATSTLEAIEYRVFLVLPASQGTLALRSAGHHSLPRLRIPEGTRPAQQITKGVKAVWGLDVLVLDIVAEGKGYLVVAELLTPGMRSDLEQATLDQIEISELSERERHRCELLLTGLPQNQCSSKGSIDEAIRWIESATGRTFSSKASIEQLNAGGCFTLLRFRSDDGRFYWMKSTGEPNRHEFSITACLSHLFPVFLPTLVGTKKEWNAWLTEDAGSPLCNPSTAVIVDGARSFANFQLQTVDSIAVLVDAGAFDQRLPILRSHVNQVVEYLMDAMACQISTKVAPLSRGRVLELGKILHDACACMEALGVPDTLLHNDLNPGNILYDGVRCVFTDWSEAAVGNPFLSLGRFCQLNVQASPEFREIYRQCWREHLSEKSIDMACSLMPLLAIYAYLYGRGHWLRNTAAGPQCESYTRTLARHMDRAAKDTLLLETLCR